MSRLRAQLFVGLSLFLVIVFWESSLVYPVKIFVVFLHETSHALVALLSGGKVLNLEFDMLEGGSTFTEGGNRFLVLNAGYVGSMIWGGLILIIASRTNLDRALTVIIGFVLCVVTFLYVKNSFAEIFGYIAGLVAMIAGLTTGSIFCEALLIHIGVTSCCYALFDIISDLFRFSPAKASDAALLAALTGVPTIVWGTIWLLVTFWGTLFYLRIALFGYFPVAEVVVVE